MSHKEDKRTAWGTQLSPYRQNKELFFKWSNTKISLCLGCFSYATHHKEKKSKSRGGCPYLIVSEVKIRVFPQPFRIFTVVWRGRAWTHPLGKILFQSYSSVFQSWQQTGSRSLRMHPLVRENLPYCPRTTIPTPQSCHHYPLLISRRSSYTRNKPLWIWGMFQDRMAEQESNLVP